VPEGGASLFAAHGHHEVYWGGIALIDPAKGYNYPHGLTKVSQELPWIEVGAPAGRPRRDRPLPHGRQLWRVQVAVPAERRGLPGLVASRPPTQVFGLAATRAGTSCSFMTSTATGEADLRGRLSPALRDARAPAPRPAMIADQVRLARPQHLNKPVQSGEFYSPNLRGGAGGSSRRAEAPPRAATDYTNLHAGKRSTRTPSTGTNGHSSIARGPSCRYHDATTGIKRCWGPCRPARRIGILRCRPHHRCTPAPGRRAQMPSHDAVVSPTSCPRAGAGALAATSCTSHRPRSAAVPGPAKPARENRSLPAGPDYSIGYHRDIQRPGKVLRSVPTRARARDGSSWT